MSLKRNLQKNLFDQFADENEKLPSKKFKKQKVWGNENKISARSKKKQTNKKIKEKNVSRKSGSVKITTQKRNAVVVKFYATLEEKNSLVEQAKISGDSVSNIIRMNMGFQRNVSGRKKKHTTAAFDLDLDD